MYMEKDSVLYLADHGQQDWPSCHVIVKLIFDVFNRHAGISAKQASLDKWVSLGACNQDNP